MTGRMLAALEPVVVAGRPDAMLVYGDTNSTLAGALVAAKLHIPIAHVEAGLRSFNRRMPEEINRVLTDHVSTWLFCPTSKSVENLRAEGIDAGVHLIGDVMYDATVHAAALAAAQSSILARLGVRPGRYGLATLHRAENTDDPARLRALIGWLETRAREHPVVFPVHPRTRLAMQRLDIGCERLRVCEPVGYLDMARLVQGAVAVYTDSGGLQKEAYFHRVPCVTLREETEWVETVTHGWNRLWQGPDYAPRREIAEYGDGHAADAIVAILRRAA
jgi:UDP-GlcNAc3NAcA epimerase